MVRSYCHHYAHTYAERKPLYFVEPFVQTVPEVTDQIRTVHREEAHKGPHSPNIVFKNEGGSCG